MVMHVVEIGAVFVVALRKVESPTMTHTALESCQGSPRRE